MSPYSCLTAALAEQHRRDLTGRADMYRRARAARSSCAVPERHAASLMKIIQRKITARWTALHLLPGWPKRIGQEP